MENDSEKDIKEEKSDKKISINYFLILIVLIMALLFPLLVVSLMKVIPSPLSGTGNIEWLSFWASYGGNIIGLLGLISVTWFQYKYQEKQLQKQMSKQHIQFIKDMKQQKDFFENQNILDDKRMKIDLVTTTLKENNIYLRKEIEDLYQTIRKINLQYNDSDIIVSELLEITDTVIKNTKNIKEAIEISNNLNEVDNVNIIINGLDNLIMLLYSLYDYELNHRKSEKVEVDTMQLIVGTTNIIKSNIDEHVNQQTKYYLSLIKLD